MKKMNKKRILVLAILILMVIIEIIAFQNSKAEDTIQVTAIIKDASGLLPDVNCTLTATNKEESGYFILLPYFIEDKRAKQYYVEEQEIQTNDKNANQTTINKIIKENTNILQFNQDEAKTNNISVLGNITNTNILSNKTLDIQQNILDTNTVTNAISNSPVNEVTNNEETQQMAETTSTVTLQVGERVFLTEEEKEAKTIVLMVEYDKKQVEEETVYYKKLEETVRRKHNLY